MVEISWPHLNGMFLTVKPNSSVVSGVGGRCVGIRGSWGLCCSQRLRCPWAAAPASCRARVLPTPPLLREQSSPVCRGSASGGMNPANLEAYIDSNRAHLPRLAQNAKFRDGRPVVETLALSGGGSDGAFGAGVLAGWTARGDRPQFEVVTGVSAGAIIAPFAFLGPRYDRQLEEIWTQYKTNELITTQILPGLLGGNSLADISPLVELVNHYIDPRLLREVAADTARGGCCSWAPLT